MFTVYKKGAFWFIFDTLARVDYRVGRSEKTARARCAQLNSEVHPC